MTLKEDAFIYHKRKVVGKAINQYKMIAGGDRVLAGLSGGKDSLVLIHAIATRRKYLPVDYDVTAVHVVVENVSHEGNVPFLEDFCGGLNVPLIINRIMLDDAIFRGTAPCVMCAKARRNAMFRLCQEQNFNKLALGHQMDDIVETLIMNMSIHAKISTMVPRLPIFGGKLDLIRPLALLTADETRQYAQLLDFPGEKFRCPYGDEHHRGRAREIVHSLESLSVNARKNIFHSMSNIHEEYLPDEIS